MLGKRRLDVNDGAYALSQIEAWRLRKLVRKSYRISVLDHHIKLARTIS